MSYRGAVEEFVPLSREKVRLVRSLARRRERRKRGVYLLEGRRLVEETVDVPDLVQFLYGRPEELTRLRGLGHPGPFFAVDETDDLFLTESSQGIGGVAHFAPAETDRLLSGSGPILLLDRISDPGNLGTIIRTADWFGFRNMLLTSGTVDPWNPKSVRATMGGILRAEIGLDVDPVQIRSSGRPVLGLTIDGVDSLTDATLPIDGVYVVGNEGEGLSMELSRLCERTIRIPGGGGESLNAAMATTLLIWELFRANE